MAAAASPARALSSSRSVVVSGPPAVGKTTVARALAGEFGMRFAGGGDALKEIAREAGHSPGGDDWWDTPDGMAFLSQRAADDTFDRRVDEELSRMFAAGGIVVTSYTLPWIVERSVGVRVWLDASSETSARRMQGRDGIAASDAAEISHRRYEENGALYRRLYGFEFGRDEGVFDVIIDTDAMDAGQVILEAKRRVGGLI